MKNISKSLNLRFTTTSEGLEQELESNFQRQNTKLVAENDESSIDLNLPPTYVISLTKYGEEIYGAIIKHKKVLTQFGTIFAFWGDAPFSYRTFDAVFAEQKVLSGFVKFFFDAKEYPISTLLNKHAELCEFFAEACYIEFKDEIKHVHGSTTIQRVTQPLFRRQPKNENSI